MDVIKFDKLIFRRKKGLPPMYKCDQVKVNGGNICVSCETDLTLKLPWNF
jgi:hypothetical protein